MQETPAEPPPQAPDDSAIGELIGAEDFGDRFAAGLEWLGRQLSSVDVSIQAAIIAVALVPALIFGSQLRKLIMAQVAPRAPYGVLRRAANAFAHIASPIALFLIWQAASFLLDAFGRPNGVVNAGLSLLMAWIVIHLVTLVIRSPFWSRVAFYIAWPVAALDVFGLLDDTIRYLDRMTLPFGQGAAGAFSAYDLFRVIILLLVLFWIASALSRLAAAAPRCTDSMIERVALTLLSGVPQDPSRVVCEAFVSSNRRTSSCQCP